MYVILTKREKQKLIFASLAVGVSALCMSVSASSLDNTGNKILNAMADVAYWAFCAKGLSEIIKNALEGNVKGAKDAFLTYGAIFGLALAFPAFLRLIQGVTKG